MLGGVSAGRYDDRMGSHSSRFVSFDHRRMPRLSDRGVELFSRATGIAEDRLRRIGAGYVTPTAREVEAIATRGLGVEVDELMTRGPRLTWR